MTRRTRKFIGTILMIVLVSVWALIAMMIAQFKVREIAGIAEFVYYVVAGIGWIFPAMLLIKWMEKPDAA
jgi:Protein of unknown function (DUF2842)